MYLLFTILFFVFGKILGIDSKEIIIKRIAYAQQCIGIYRRPLKYFINIHSAAIDLFSKPRYGFTLLLYNFTNLFSDINYHNASSHRHHKKILSLITFA